MDDFLNRALDLLTGANGEDQFAIQIEAAIRLRCKGTDIDLNAIIDRFWESAQTKQTYRDQEPVEREGLDEDECWEAG